MTKRLLCLMLCIVMLISTFVLSGCSSSDGDSDDDVAKEASRGTKTLNMYVMTEEGTDPEAAKAVEAEVNKITKSKFKTKINLFFYTEADYYTALEKAFNDRETVMAEKKAASEALKQYIKDNKEMSRAEASIQFYIDHPEYKQYEETTVDPEAETTAEETIFNEDTGLLELKYPEADPNVADIFFISGYDKYTEYIGKGWLSKLDDQLSGASKKIKNQVSDIFISNVKYNSATYAIPNNRAIGEYTYMLVNKELLSKYYYNISSIKTLADCRDFLEDIAEFEKDVVPIDGSPDMYNVFYWNIDPDTLEIKSDDFSIFGRVNSITSSYGDPMIVSSLLYSSKKQYGDQLLANKLYEERGYFRADVAEDAKCAVKIVKGGAELKKLYADEYEVVVLENPCASSADIYQSMFAVGGYTSDVARSMEIITELNTNAELRNLLQYGIEEVNYTLDDNGQVVYTEDNKYFMDIYKTGNAFIAYTEAGTDADIWTYGMDQNKDANLYMLHGFTMAPDKVDKAAIRKMQQLSDSVKARIDACKTHDELSALLDVLYNELRTQTNADVKHYVSSDAEATGGLSTPYVLLYQWMLKNKIVSEE